MHSKNSPDSPPTDFGRIVESDVSRRAFLEGSIACGTNALLFPFACRGSTGPATRAMHPVIPLDFDPVSAGTRDTVVVPKGFKWYIVGSWGDPLWSGIPPFDPHTRGTPESQEHSLGDNNDGMELFVNGGRVILAVNHEYFNGSIMFGNRKSNLPESPDDARKALMAVGVSIFEIARSGNRWRIVKDSPVNRRITATTEMEITGPAAGHEKMRTSYAPSGRSAQGTWANCGSGKTPWGTYLSCEENFDYFFPRYKDKVITTQMKRYSVGSRSGARLDLADPQQFGDTGSEINAANHVGYVVEVDPSDPDSLPRKHTALGRFKHENAEVVLTGDGKVVVYMGDDEHGEFLYRFVSQGRYPAATSSLLHEGTLYVAKFYDSGRGEWLALTPESTGMESEEICIFTRIAASKAGATTMDRPEWVAAHPHRAEVYCALTNNEYRDTGTNNRGGDEMPASGPNPRRENKYGQIVRWSPDAGDHSSNGFRWDLFVLAGNPDKYTDEYAGSGNIHAGNMFNSPDGIAFDSCGGLWIQTDGDFTNKGDFAGHGNNQMLLGNPDSGEIKRFLVGPKEAEITGLCWSDDKKTMFVGIQHPGEKTGQSRFPGHSAIPRSSIIAIERDDGGEMG